MRRIKRQSGLWRYLKDLGVLERGIEEEIQKARKDYWRLYNTRNKRQQRGKKKSTSISYDSEEFAILGLASSKHGMPIASYVKQAALAYSKNAFVVPNPATLYQILQLMVRTQSHIEQIAGKEKNGWLQPDRNYQELQSVIRALQNDFAKIFASPPSLESVIKGALKTTPSFINTLKQILSEYDCKKP